MAGHNSGRARTFRFSEGVNGFFSAANCDFYFPLSHWIPQRSLSQVASDRLQSFFVHHAVALFLRIIAPGVCLSKDIVTNSDRLLLPPRERLMG